MIGTFIILSMFPRQLFGSLREEEIDKWHGKGFKLWRGVWHEGAQVNAIKRRSIPFHLLEIAIKRALRRAKSLCSMQLVTDLAKAGAGAAQGRLREASQGVFLPPGVRVKHSLLALQQYKPPGT